EAEKELRRAVALGDQHPEPWVALVFFLTGAGQKAAAATEEARQKLPPDRAPLALAHCYEAIGKPEQADEQFQAALKARPDDVVVLRGVASSPLRRGQLALAVPHLRKILALKADPPPAEKAWARRQLALALAAGGQFAQFQEALALLDENARSSDP